ncbi:probable RCO3 glucose transporter [Fusarium fujikuroi]|nr:putative RCO3 glucose transporter [Fusarium fujikuroi]SCN82759.1 probable RCO3 glucose transporter [Fusarium fujikuroi]SCO09260.1 probable RCO3 glucose transporter [Fusarium fujikuroi]SCO21691.1 probable RCO3 glucose transporter [Fusarium fujikuroi]SCO53511.1 probable RCO3 glucose transporter [Fusarium fujikuroi]
MMLLGMGWHKPDNFAGSSSWAITIGLFVASGGLLFGYDLGVINGILAMAVFKDHFSTNQSCKDDQGHIDLCPEDSSLIVAILSGGAVIGALVAAPSGDSIGRRKTLLAAVTTFCIGAIFQICARATPMLLVGRLLAGVAVGAISVLVPLYQSETAPKWIRGTIICMYQFSITVGILTATTINVGTSNIDSGAAYRIPLGIQLVPGLILACGIVYLPETPRFLVKKGRLLEAEVSLSRFRRLDKTHPALVDELQEIIANHQYELTLGLDTYKALFARNSSLGRRTMTGCGLQMLQQLTGINFVMYYGTTFFSNAGVNKPFLTNLAMIIINCVCTVPGLIVIESWGRRKLLMAGALGMGISQLLIAAVYSATQDKMEKSHGGAANMVLVVFCALNIFPLKVRAKAMSVSTTANWLLNFGVAYAPPYILGRGANAFGLKIFFIWGSCCLLSIAFVWLMVYETSKMTLEQIDEMYERVRHAWESPGFNPTWSFQQMQNAGWAANEQPEQQAGDGHSASNVNSTDDESHETAPIRPDISHGSTTPMVNLDFSY